MNFGFKRPSVFFCFFFRKRSLNFFNLSDLGQRSMKDPDLGLS